MDKIPIEQLIETLYKEVTETNARSEAIQQEIRVVYQDMKGIAQTIGGLHRLIQGLQNDVLQLRMVLGQQEIKPIEPQQPSPPASVDEKGIKWDERDPDNPESIFDFKKFRIPNR